MEKDGIKIQSAVLIAALVLFAFFSAVPLRKARVRKHAGAPPVAIEVKGEVARPGIYILESSVATVAAAAAMADRRIKISDAMARLKLTPGQSLEIVRSKTGAEIKLGRMSGAALLAMGLKLDLNSAGLDDLLLVPHLRPAIAREIVKRRSQKAWENVDDLQELRGVGPKTVQKLGDYLEVSNAPLGVKKREAKTNK
ncbi:MAG: helix-hairpin-helix domain-containing protein [Syntrophobacteraceae bacterium]|nr:helix-hairpin-helix domain-containing protein [Syntrophobacteraceae bacterium]